MAKATDMRAFERATLYRLCTEAARYWVISHFLVHQALPAEVQFYTYPNGEVSFDWGNPAGPASVYTPLRGKRITITMRVEDC